MLMNKGKGGGKEKRKPKDKSLEEAIISDEENEPLDLIYGNQKFNPKTGMYQTMKKGGQVKKRNNFSGRGAGRCFTWLLIRGL